MLNHSVHNFKKTRKIKLGKTDKWLLIGALVGKGSISVDGKRQENSAYKLEKLNIVKISHTRHGMIMTLISPEKVGELLGKGVVVR